MNRLTHTLAGVIIGASLAAIPASAANYSPQYDWSGCTFDIQRFKPHPYNQDGVEGTRRAERITRVCPNGRELEAVRWIFVPDPVVPQ